MILETERLYFRELNQADFNSLCEILQDEDTMYAYEGAFNDKEVLEIGYLFNRLYWHNGYAIEAAKACKKYAFETLPSFVKDTHALNHTLCLIFCVVLSRRTSSTPPSSALKIRHRAMVRVEKLKRDKIQPLQGT